MSEYKQTFPDHVSNPYGLDCIPVCEVLELYILEGTGMAQLGENTKLPSLNHSQDGKVLAIGSQSYSDPKQRLLQSSLRSEVSRDS